MTNYKINTEKLSPKKVFYALCKYAFQHPVYYSKKTSAVEKIIVNTWNNFQIVYEDIELDYSTRSRCSSSVSIVPPLKLPIIKESISSDEEEGRSSGQSTDIEKQDTADSNEEKISSDESSDSDSEIQFTYADAEKLFKANSTKQFQEVIINKHTVALPISMLHFAQYLDVQSFDAVYGPGAVVKAILAEYPDLTAADLEYKDPLAQATADKSPVILNSFMQSLKCCYSPVKFKQVDVATENVNARSPIKSYRVIKSVPHVQKKYSLGS